MKDDPVELVYLAQSLAALVGIQSLPYHNFRHTLNVMSGTGHYYRGTPYEFAAICAAANHDAVLCYRDPPGKCDHRAFHQARLEAEKVNLSKSHCYMYENHADLIRALQSASKQERRAGFELGDSERESYEKMERELKYLLEIIADDQVTAKIQEQQSFRAEAIKGTIPDLSNLTCDTFNTIANVSVIPGPFKLAAIEEPLQSQLVAMLDATLHALIPHTTTTFAKALQELPHFVDPFKQLKKIPQERIVSALAKQLKKDKCLLSYMEEQVVLIGLPLADLGHFSRNNAMMLIVEDHASQANDFLAVEKELNQKGLTLASEEVHKGLSGDRGFQEFKHIVNCWMNDQITILEGRAALVQHYIYEPMKAIQTLTSSLNPFVTNFESTFSRDQEAIVDIQDFLKNSQTAGSLCHNILQSLNFERSTSSSGSSMSCVV